MKRLIAMLLVLLIMLSGFQLFKLKAGENQWIKTFGGDQDDGLNCVLQTPDGGYIAAGYTKSFGAGNYDALLIKLDSQGNIIWSKTFGGDQSILLNPVLQTSDGYYILGGNIVYSDSNTTDLLLIKLDSQGNIIWSKTFGGDQKDVLFSVLQTPDGGYIAAGYTKSFGAGNHDFLLIKLDSQGNIIWSKTFGGDQNDFLTSLQQTLDGGYIIGGISRSFNSKHHFDTLLIKVDSQGNIIWSKTFEKGGTIILLKQTNDGGCLVSGIISSFKDNNGSIILNLPFLMKLDSEGKIIWEKQYQIETEVFIPSFIEKTNDGGYILGGLTEKNISLFIKTDFQGDVIWARMFGGDEFDDLETIIQTSDGGYVLGGSAQLLNSDNFDCLMIKMNSEGKINNCDDRFTDVLMMTYNDNYLNSQNVNVHSNDCSLTTNNYQLITNQVTLNVHSFCVVDTTPPEITILFPQNNSFTNQSKIVVRGTVKDEESGVKLLTINGEIIGISSNGDFEKEIQLVEGENQINVVAEDNVGNQIEKSIKITLDIIPPKIILNTAIPPETYSSPLVITGQIVDRLSGIKNNIIQINDKAVSLSKNFTFSCALNLKEGVNDIVLIAEDNAGNITREVYTTKYINQTILKFQINNPVMYINDKPVLLDVAPIIIENRTMLPIRWIVEPLGAKVDWNATEKKVTISLKTTIIELWIGKSIAKINGRNTPIDSNNSKVVPIIKNNRAFIPLRFISESLGCDVQWDGVTKIITITYSNNG